MSVRKQNLKMNKANQKLWMMTRIILKLRLRKWRLSI